MTAALWSELMPYGAPELKRSALKTLFRAEHFNVMDGLDVYIDDYTKPSPIPAEWYARMAQMAGLGDVAGRAEAAAKSAAEALGRVEEPQPSAISQAAATPTEPLPAPPDASRDEPHEGDADSSETQWRHNSGCRMCRHNFHYCIFRAARKS